MHWFDPERWDNSKQWAGLIGRRWSQRFCDWQLVERVKLLSKDLELVETNVWVKIRVVETKGLIMLMKPLDSSFRENR